VANAQQLAVEQGAPDYLHASIVASKSDVGCALIQPPAACGPSAAIMS
jgi:hypothetical protein